MTTQEVRVPDIGDFKDVRVVELLVKAGDEVTANSPLVVLETDKATLEIPTLHGGVVRELRVAVGDLVSEHSPIAVIELPEQVAEAAERPREAQSTTGPSHLPSAPSTSLPVRAVPNDVPSELKEPHAHGPVRASPALRRYARSLGVDLTRLSVGASNARVTREDVESYVKRELESSTSKVTDASFLSNLPFAEAPGVDHAKFGRVEQRPLSRIRRLSGANLVRNWVTIPHVTNFDEADVTELEAFRTKLNSERGATGKITLLAFLLKACAGALRNFPELRSSLSGDALIVKEYFHIGFAAETAEGLMVPVIRDVDRKSVLELASEAAELAAAARAGKLRASDLQGGCFSISSLGGIGGTHFTPIINAPEVSILGAGRITERLVLDEGTVQSRKVLPLSLSWDHRALDGALAARFLVQLTKLLADVRRMLL